jgi:hypothetical protein
MDETWHPEHFQCYGCLVQFSANMSYRPKVRILPSTSDTYELLQEGFTTALKS